MRYVSVISGVAAALALAATASAGSFENKAQVTVGGAEYMLTGHIVKIEKDAYWIRKASGDVVRVAVTEGTHLICPTRPGIKEAKVESKPGSGFRIGDCPFIRGDTVKAEISDLGWASLVRSDVPPPSQTAQLGLPQGWDGDMSNGVLSFKTGPRYPVFTKDGHQVGHLAGTLTDTILGTDYGLIEQAADRQMIAVPVTGLRQEWPEPNKPRVVLLINKERSGRYTRLRTRPRTLFRSRRSVTSGQRPHPPNLLPHGKLTWPSISARKPFTSPKGEQSGALLSWQGCRRSFNFATGISWRMSLCPHCSAMSRSACRATPPWSRQHEPLECASIQGKQ